MELLKRKKKKNFGGAKKVESFKDPEEQAAQVKSRNNGLKIIEC